MKTTGNQDKADSQEIAARLAEWEAGRQELWSDDGLLALALADDMDHASDVLDEAQSLADDLREMADDISAEVSMLQDRIDSFEVVE